MVANTRRRRDSIVRLRNQMIWLLETKNGFQASWMMTVTILRSRAKHLFPLETAAGGQRFQKQTIMQIIQAVT
jgi:hypothetical protein